MSKNHKEKKQNSKKVLIKDFLSFVKKYKRVPTLKEFSDSSEHTRNKVKYHFGGINNLLEEAYKQSPSLIDKAKKAEEKESTANKTLKAYTKLVKDGVKFPTRSDLKSLGISRDVIRQSFGTLSKLRKKAKETDPEAFVGVVDPNSNNPSRKSLSKYKRFFITTAVNGQDLHKGALDTVSNWCKKYNAKILFLPSHDPAHNLDNQVEWHFDNEIAEHDIIFNQLDLNSNLHISDIRVTAKQINPTTGLSRISQGKGSFIFGSPKQYLEYVAVSNEKMPHALMTPGAITYPNYKTTRGNSLRSASLATYDHVMGGIIVEIVDNNLYHFRQVQFDEEGGFCDLGKYYIKDKSEDIDTDIVFGDWHAGDHDPVVKKASFEIANYVKAKRGFMHDLFNGKSISHHDKDDLIIRTQRSKEGKLDLEKELEITGNEINDLLEVLDEIIVTKSNHDEWLARYLRRGGYNHDPQNRKVGWELSLCMLENLDPLQEGIKKYGNVKKLDKVKWLQRDEDFKVAGIELGAHGDKGPNGSRGTANNLEKAYGKATFGHRHTPGITRQIFHVGTTTYLKLEYNEGPSSWMNTHCLTYSNGHRQLINIIEGKWKR